MPRSDAGPLDLSDPSPGDYRFRFDLALEVLVESTRGLGAGMDAYALQIVEERFGAAFPHEPRMTQAHRLLHLLGERDGWTCAYCGAPVRCPCRPDGEWAVSDHVIPKSRGGPDDPSNRVLACGRCNTDKGARTPEEWRASA